MSGRPERIAPLAHGFFNRLREAERQRVERAIFLAVRVEVSAASVALRSGLRLRQVVDLRSNQIAITENHLKALAPLISTTPEAVLGGTWGSNGGA